MCGILGWVGVDSATPQAIERCHGGLEAIRNRGPDGTRLEKGQDWLLGHTRLAILDLTERASQPMCDGAGRWIVFNGEIYNFQELRQQLQAYGIRFQSTGDTEVLLAALGLWGLGALTLLRGMFAFGWLDPDKQELLLARDRYGVKPLVWEKTRDGVRFASDLFGLDAMAGGGRVVDPESARQYLMLGYVPSPRCIWKGPRKLKPGHYLRVRWDDGGRVEIAERSYWTLAEVPQAGDVNDNDIGSRFTEEVREAVRLRFISDVPVGLLLSGGIDSSLVAAVCAQLPDADVTSYTMGFADTSADERPFAKQTASHLGLKHEDFLAESADIATEFEEVWKGFDEPFADSSALPTLILCREMRNRVKVVVGGDGGDEVWCGYPWHRALDRVESGRSWPLWLRRLGASAGHFAGKRLRYQSRVVAARDRIEAWALLKTSLTALSIRWLPICGGESTPPSELFREAATNVGTIMDPLDWASRMDLATYLPDDLMVKADRASMRSGLELREPLLDHQLTSWGLSLPMAQRFDRSTRMGKQSARRYLASRLPQGALDRTKQGFTPPLPSWLSGPLRSWRDCAVQAIEFGNLGPLQLPDTCHTWTDCSQRLQDNYHQFLWRIVCFHGWWEAAKQQRAKGK